MGNTEGSQVIKNIFHFRKNGLVILNEKQMSVVIGSILGDAYIYPAGKICFEHSEKQYSYLMWKFDFLKKVSYPKVSRVERFDKRFNHINVSYRFFLRQYFKTLREIFYPAGVKIIPQGIDKWFSPLTLAVWYMDDGYLKNNKYPELATESFSLEQLSYIKFLLSKKYFISSDVTNKQRLRIKLQSIKSFFSLISSYIHQSMTYKLP